MDTDLVVKTDEDASLVGVQTQLSQVDKSKEAEKYMHNLQRRARYHSYSLMKQVLVDYIKGCVRGWASCYHFDSGKSVLVIELDCGNAVDYKTFDDIPNEDVPCPCGNPKHWFIRYMDLRDN